MHTVRKDAERFRMERIHTCEHTVRIRTHAAVATMVVAHELAYGVNE